MTYLCYLCERKDRIPLQCIKCCRYFCNVHMGRHECRERINRTEVEIFHDILGENGSISNRLTDVEIGLQESMDKLREEVEYLKKIITMQNNAQLEGLRNQIEQLKITMAQEKIDKRYESIQLMPEDESDDDSAIIKNIDPKKLCAPAGAKVSAGASRSIKKPSKRQWK